jgi:hypothetical protein
MRWHRASDPNKRNLPGTALIVLYTLHTCMIIAINLGLQLTHTEQGLWIYGLCFPMIVAWLALMVDLFIWPE